MANFWAIGLKRSYKQSWYISRIFTFLYIIKKVCIRHIIATKQMQENLNANIFLCKSWPFVALINEIIGSKKNTKLLPSHTISAIVIIKYLFYNKNSDAHISLLQRLQIQYCFGNTGNHNIMSKYKDKIKCKYLSKG